VKGSYLRAQFLRMKDLRGARKRVLAVVASMLTAACFMPREGVEYFDFSANLFDRHDRTKTIRQLLNRSWASRRLTPAVVNEPRLLRVTSRPLGRIGAGRSGCLSVPPTLQRPETFNPSQG